MTAIEESRASWMAGSEDHVVADSTWDAFVESHRYGHFLQTSVWRDLKAEFGWSGEGVTLYNGGDEIVGGASILFRRVAGLTIGYAPRGPVTDWENREATASLLAQLEASACRRGAVALIIEPSLPDTRQNHHILAGYGFRPSSYPIQPRSSIQLDITQGEDAILRQMKSKWRYNIRLSDRKEVSVRTATQEDLRHFRRLMQVTGERDGFGVHSAAYYARAFDLFVPQRGVYLIAEYNNRPLGAIVVVCSGDTAIYLWGASSSEERNRMPNHALQWAGIRWAIAAGARRYDLWGIPDEIGAVATGMAGGHELSIETHNLPLNLEEAPSHDLWGVFRFKQGFGGNIVRTVGAWERPLHPAGYGLYRAGRYARSLPKEWGALRTEMHHQARRYGRRLWQICTDINAPSVPVAGSPYTRQVVCADEWRGLLGTLSAQSDYHPHVLQSWEWGAVKAQTGWQANRFAVQSASGDPVGAFQLLRRRLVPGIPFFYGYTPKGPIGDWRDPVVSQILMASVQQAAKDLNCIAVKIDPDIGEDSIEGQRIRDWMTRHGWHYSREQIQFKNTAVSNLCEDEQELLSGMKSKWRYNIRLAQRRGVQIRTGSEDDLEAFYRLYADTGRRDGFAIRPMPYYLAIWRTFLAAQQDERNPAGGALLMAGHGEESGPLAGIFLLRYDRYCWYFYGASSNRRRRDMPNYLLQWEAIRWAKAQDCTRYDWWGAPTDIEDDEDELQGVWRFKQGFGATFVPQIGAWDYPIRPRIYRLFADAMRFVLHLLRVVRTIGKPGAQAHELDG